MTTDAVEAMLPTAAALADGTWRSVGGIQRWAADNPPDPQPIDLHALIACPTCRARVDECCRTTSGHTTAEHGSRLVSRRCPCGERPGWNRMYCEPCAKRSEMKSKRDHLRRLRAAKARRPTVQRRAS
jgi:hypothetical protein